MNGIHKILALLAILTFTLEAKTQELNCEISVMAPQINNIDASVFETMESTIREFMNGRKWTNDYFDFDEIIHYRNEVDENDPLRLPNSKDCLRDHFRAAPR